MNLKIFCDGGARGNPGPAAWAFVVLNEKNQLLDKKNGRIGQTTNNVAEYTAVVRALEWLKDYRLEKADYRKGERVDFFLDSKLVTSQLNGLFKVKNARMRELIVKVRVAEQVAGGDVFYTFIPRDKNCAADFLVNQALDN